MGDTVYLQSGGGPIGLELTGAVSRAFMMRWDKLYLKRTQEASIKMLLYERYVDDSNQIAIVPPKGSIYDKTEKRIVIDPEKQNEDTEEDERLAKILLSIPNDIMPCVVMEGDWPSKNRDYKLPILDMKVWTDASGTLLYQHYEKPVSSKTVLNSKSAHSTASKRSVHTQEVIRRLLNCSVKLDWETEIAPFVSDYMNRMRVAGYTEEYRRSILESALNIFDEKWKDNNSGKRPIFRPKDWKEEERKEAKERKKLEWSSKGGHIAPIFVPATPGGELMKTMKKVADREAKEGIHFKVVEMGGRTLKSELQKSNPIATPGCDEANCLGCTTGRGKGGQCRRNNVNYQITCQLCPDDSKAVYIGETSRNLYTRAMEHKSNTKEESSFMKKHMSEKHQGKEENFSAKVTHQNKDCLTRLVREGVLIRRCGQPLMNSKTEWYQPSIYRIQKEIVRD